MKQQILHNFHFKTGEDQYMIITDTEKYEPTTILAGATYGHISGEWHPPFKDDEFPFGIVEAYAQSDDFGSLFSQHELVAYTCQIK